jgi:hypothetical protein
LHNLALSTNSGNSAITTYLRQIEWVLYGIPSLGTQILIGLFFVAQADRSQTAQGDLKAAAKMLDVLANRNKPPKLVLPSSQKHEIRKLAKWVPLFPQDYDWKEQDRVVKALNHLRNNMTVDWWEELVRTKDDPRYSLTIISPDTGSASNWTVGDFCHFLGYMCLVDVVRRDWPKKRDRRIGLGLGIRDLTEWRKERMHKSVYELQIELYERALAQLPTVKYISQEQKEATRKKIESAIEKLKRTKQPIFLNYPLFGKASLYTPAKAKRIRKMLAKEKKR